MVSLTKRLHQEEFVKRGGSKNRRNCPHGNRRFMLKTAGSSVPLVGTLPQTKSRYKVVAIGGTFDVFHRGHEQLVSKAFDAGERVLIGVTSDSYVRKLRKTHTVQSYVTRVSGLRRYLRQKRWSSRATIALLRDPYGPAARRKDLEALVITPDSLSNALKLNQLRQGNGLRVVKIHRIPLSRAEDGRLISSTRIRRGEIDREGRVLRNK